MKPAIAIITNSLQLGGTELHLSQVLPELQNHGWQVEIFLLAAAGDLVDTLRQRQIKVATPWLSNYVNSGSLAKIFVLTLNSLRLFIWLAQRRQHIVHFFLPEAYLIGGICGWLLLHDCMLMSRRSMNFYQRKYPVAKQLELWLHKRMRMIVANSRANLQQLIIEEGVSVAKTQLLYNGIDLSRFTGSQHRIARGGDLISTEHGQDFINNIKDPNGNIRHKYGIDPDALVLVKVANLSLVKGHAVLLRALHSVKVELDQLAPGWRMLCVGEPRDQATNLLALTEQLALTTRVIWLTEVGSALAEVLLAADIGLLCSDEEGFSNAILEGMAAGLPMIVTDVGGNAEAVVNGETGIVVPKGEVTELAAAILTLVKSKDLRRQYGSAGKQRVEKYFSLPVCVNNYLTLYNNLL